MKVFPVILIALAVAGSLAWWWSLAGRPKVRRELWPTFCFRPVPWGAFDVLAAFFLVLLMAGLPWDRWLFTANSLGNDDRPDASAVSPSAVPGQKEDGRRSHAVAFEDRSLPGDDEFQNAVPQDAESRGAQPSDSEFRGAESQDAQFSASESDRERSHGLWILLQDRPTFTTFLLCFLVAVVAAPVMEETLFRLLFQGWLATCEWRLRRRLKGWYFSRNRETERLPILRPRWFGIIPVLVVAVCFSLIHVRSTSDVLSAEGILAIMLCQVCGYGVAFPMLVLWLKCVRGVGARAWGLTQATFWPDVLLGLRWFATLALPIYGLQAGLSAITPESVVVDPLTLFPFGLVAGVLCLRSGRVLPAIIFHMALNGTSLALAVVLLLSGASL